MATSETTSNGKPINETLRNLVRRHQSDRLDYREPSFLQLPGFIKLLESLDHPIDDSRQGVDLTEKEHDEIYDELTIWRHSLSTGMQAMAALIPATRAEEDTPSAALVDHTRILSDLACLENYFRQQQEMLERSKPMLPSRESARG